jgi:hypothetical protein
VIEVEAAAADAVLAEQVENSPRPQPVENVGGAAEIGRYASSRLRISSRDPRKRSSKPT